MMFMSRNGINDGKALLFAPEKRFDLPFFAEVIVAVMREAGVGARAWFPGDIVADFDADATVEDVIEGYQSHLAGLMPLRNPANQNKSLLSVITK